MKKINSLISLATSLIITAPLVMTAFAETVNEENGYVTAFAAKADKPAYTQEAVPQDLKENPAVTTAPFLNDDDFQTTTTMTTTVPLWPELHFDADAAIGQAGDTFTFIFMGYDGDTVESPIRFTVSDESIVRITKTEGMKVTFEMLATGNAVIRGTTPDGRYAEFLAEVREPEIIVTEPLPVSDVSFSKDTVYLDAGETVEIEVQGYEGNLYDEYDGIHNVNLYCYDKDVVRVVNTEGNKFTLEGVSTGFTHIYADFGSGFTASMRVFVLPLPELRLEPESVEIYPEDYYQVVLKEYIEYNDSIPADGTTVTYTFDDPNLVEITEQYDDHIDFKGVASGSTILHATVPDGRTAAIPVKVLPNKFRFSDAEYECLPGAGHSLFVKGGDAVFSVADDGIIQVTRTDNRTLEFTALTPGETTVTATCGDETITARIIVTDPATTTTTTVQTTLAFDGYGTTGLTTVTTPETTTVAETTIVTTAPTGNLPQTGNNDVTGILVIIGAFVLTGTGITVLKLSGIHDSKEQCE